MPFNRHFWTANDKNRIDYIRLQGYLGMVKNGPKTIVKLILVYSTAYNTCYCRKTQHSTYSKSITKYKTTSKKNTSSSVDLQSKKKNILKVQNTPLFHGVKSAPVELWPTFQFNPTAANGLQVKRKFQSELWFAWKLYGALLTGVA